MIAGVLTETLVKMSSHLGVGRVHLWRFRCTRLNPYFAQQAIQSYQQVLDLYQQVEESMPERALHSAEAAIYAHAEMGWVLLVDGVLRQQHGGEYVDVDKVIAHWQEAEQLAQQRGSPENLHTVYTTVIEVCKWSYANARSLLDSAAELQRYCAQVSERE